MPKAPGAQQPTYTARDTGVDKDAGKVIFWDPIKQAYAAAPYSWDMWSKGGERNKYAYYVNSKGEMVYGLKPPSTHQVHSGGEGIAREGNDPNWKPVTVPDLNGMGTNGGTRAPTNTTGGAIPPWQGSSSHGPDGNVIPGGPADPGTYGPGGTDFWAPGTPAPGTPGTPGGTNWGGQQLFQPHTPGEDATWGQAGKPGNNRDFYAAQFGKLVGQQNAFQQQQLAAGIRRALSESVPQRPVDYKAMWAAMGMPEVQRAQETPQGQQFAWNAANWLKPGVTTNAEIYQQSVAAGKNPANPLFDPNHPDMKATNWSTMNPEAAYASYVTPQTHPSWVQQLQNAWNNAWSRSDLTPPPGGGPTAATGYALPVEL